MLLVTLPGWNLDGSADHFRVVEHADFRTVTVRFPDRYAEPRRTFASLQDALFVLGGIVPWARWTPATQEDLLTRNNGRII